MKKLSLLLLASIMFIPCGAYAQESGRQGAYLDARVQPTDKELRKNKKRLMTEHEIDSLIVSHNFKFEPLAAYTSKKEIYDYIYIADKEKRRKKDDLLPELRRRMTVTEAKNDLKKGDNGLLSSILSPEQKELLNSLPDSNMAKTKANKRIVVLPEDYISIIGGWLRSYLYHECMPLNQGGPPPIDDLDVKPDPIYTDAFKFTESVKEEDKNWFVTVELDRMNELLKYEFVIQPTGWTALRCTSNRWGGNIIYTGWLITN